MQVGTQRITLFAVSCMCAGIPQHLEQSEAKACPKGTLRIEYD
jgi:hypothetical protein